MIQELSFSDDCKSLLGFGEADLPPASWRLDLPFASAFVHWDPKGWKIEQGTDFESPHQQLSLLHGANIRWKGNCLTGEGMMILEEGKSAVWTQFKYDFQHTSIAMKWIPGPFSLQILCVSGSPSLKFDRNRKGQPHAS
jgi:hypothetical protein